MTGACVDSTPPSESNEPVDGDGNGDSGASGSGNDPSDAGPVAAEDATGGTADDAVVAAEDVKKDGQCGLSDPQNFKIGMPCSAHTQCESCYCYDEEYLSPFRFCTINCSSGKGSACADWENPLAEFPELACIRFTQKLIDTYDLDVESVCMPRCDSVEKCKIYGPDYNYCPFNGTSWEGATIQAVPTCQTSEQ